MNQIRMQQALMNIAVILMLGYCYYRLKKNKRYDYKYFMLFIFMSIIGNVFELIDALTGGYLFGTSCLLEYIFVNGYNTCILVADGAWFINCLDVTNNRLYKNKTLLNIVMIPLVVIMLMSWTSAIHHKIFYIDSGMNYVRGEWFLYYTCIALIYLVVAFVIFLASAMQKELYTRRRTNLYAASFSVFMFLSMWLQVVTKGMISVISVAATIVVFAIYETLRDEEITTDGLTGINNRNAVNLYIKRILKKENRDYHTVIFDIDLFKSINDTYGHPEGDKALVRVANVLSNLAAKSHFIGRIGGDEFIAIVEGYTLEDVEKWCTEVKKSVVEKNEEDGEEYSLSVSAGISRWTEEMKTVPDVLKMADIEMYKEKKKRRAGRKMTLLPKVKDEGNNYENTSCQPRI